MYTYILFRIILLLLVAASVAFAQSKNTDKEAATRSLNAQTPYLIGLSVANVDDAVRWYEDKLGFKVVKRMELPKYDLRLVFLELNGFRIELFENKKSFSVKKYVSDYKEMSGLLQGVAKFGFLVDDAEMAAKILKERGVQFEVELREDKGFGVKFFIISDNSGNLIQYFQKLKS